MPFSKSFERLQQLPIPFVEQIHRTDIVFVVSKWKQWLVDRTNASVFGERAVEEERTDGFGSAERGLGRGAVLRKKGSDVRRLARPRMMIGTHAAAVLNEEARVLD